MWRLLLMFGMGAFCGKNWPKIQEYIDKEFPELGKFGKNILSEGQVTLAKIKERVEDNIAEAMVEKENIVKESNVPEEGGING